MYIYKYIPDPDLVWLAFFLQSYYPRLPPLHHHYSHFPTSLQNEKWKKNKTDKSTNKKNFTLSNSSMRNCLSEVKSWKSFKLETHVANHTLQRKAVRKRVCLSLSLSLTHSLTHSYYLDTYRWCIYSVNSPVTTHSNRSIRRDAILMLHVNLNPLGLNDVCDLLCDHLSFVYILLRRSWISCSITRSYTRIAVIIQFYEKSSIIVFSTREGFMWGRQYVLIEDVLRWVSDIYRSGDRCYSREHRTLQFIIKDYYS